ncbi:MAG TPA: PEGA domain-containing protein [Thermoanaerobaculia bacterium]|nr:PEGA domain-containing protein [Thermoanaerobaculia bacterium]
MRAFLFLPLFTLISCATVLSGPREDISVRSSPSGANATLRCADGIERTGTTPATLTIPRKAHECSVRVTMAGYADETVKLEDEWNGRMWGNFGFAPLAPYGIVQIVFIEGDAQSRLVGAASLITAGAVWIIDRHTGAAFEHAPNVIDVALVRRE